jgi:hypothetical protein
MSREEVLLEGMNAYLAECKISDCPYHSTDPLWFHWRQGWLNEFTLELIPEEKL